MPDSPSGVYTLPPSYKVANGDLTDASQHNPPFEDVQQALTNRLHRDGRTPWTGNQNANNNKLTNLKDGSDPQDAATVGQAVPRVGDCLDTYANPGSNWLRRDGGVYQNSAYPVLAPLMLPVAGDVDFYARTTGTSTNLNSIVDGPLGMVAVGNSGLIIYSEDRGETWDIATSGVSTTLSKVIYVSPNYIACAGDGKLLTSVDMKNWSETSVGSGAGTFVTDIAYGDGVYLAVTLNAGVRSVWRSTNLTTWATVSLPGNPNIQAVTYGGGRFVVTSSFDAEIYRSPTGAPDTWSVVETGFYGGNVWYANGRYIIAAGTGSIRYSTDSTTWSSAATGFSQIVTGIVYADGNYIAVGAGGGFAVSPNLAAWSQKTSEESSFTSLVFSEDIGMFTMTGSAGHVTQAEVFGTDFFRVPDDNPTTGWIRAK